MEDKYLFNESSASSQRRGTRSMPKTKNRPATICQTFAHDPAPMSRKPRTLWDSGFVVRLLEDAMDFHLDNEPAVQVLASWSLVAQNGLETCPAQPHRHQRSHLAQKEATPNQCKAVVAKKQGKSLLCKSELHAMILGASLNLTAKIHLVLPLANRLDRA